jgi:hypothetical protein
MPAGFSGQGLRLGNPRLGVLGVGSQGLGGRAGRGLGALDQAEGGPGLDVLADRAAGLVVRARAPGADGLGLRHGVRGVRAVGPDPPGAAEAGLCARRGDGVVLAVVIDLGVWMALHSARGPGQTEPRPADGQGGIAFRSRLKGIRVETDPIALLRRAVAAGRMVHRVVPDEIIPRCGLVTSPGAPTSNIERRPLERTIRETV